MILQIRSIITGTALAMVINEFMEEKDKSNIKRDIAWVTATISNTFITLNITSKTKTKRSKSIPTPPTTKETK